MDGATVNQRAQGLGWLGVVGGTLIFSTGGIIIRFVELPAIAIVFLTQIVSLGVLVCWQLQTFRSNWRVLKQQRESFYRILLLGTLRAVDRLAFTAAVLLAPIAKVLVVSYLFPIFTMILAHHFLRERFTMRSVGAALTALTGVVILVLPELRESGNDDLTGMTLAGLVALVVAVIRIVLKGVDPAIPTPFMLTMEGIVATIVLSPVMLITLPIQITSSGALLIVFLGVLQGVVAHFIVLAGLRRIPAGPASIVGYLEVVSAALLAWWILSEPLTFYTLAGGLLVLTGSLSAILMYRSKAGYTPALGST